MRQFVQEHIRGPAVAHHVVRGEQQRVVIRFEADNFCANQRAFGEIEWCARVLSRNAPKFGFPRGWVQRRKIAQRNLNFQFGPEMQIESVGIGRSAKSIVSGEKSVDGVTKRGDLERALEIHAERFVERTGRVIPEFRREEYFPLRLGHVRLKNLLDFGRNGTQD